MSRNFEPHLLTPYSRPRLLADVNDCPDVRTIDHTYHLFCLRTRLSPLLTKLNLDDYAIDFSAVDRGTQFITGITLVNAGEKIELSSSIIEQLQAEVNTITTIKPDHCLLFSPDTPIWIDDIKIPYGWIESILPYIPIDPDLDPYLNSGHLYVNLSQVEGKSDEYDRLNLMIEDLLLDYYQRGVVVSTSSFAEDWDLLPLEQTEDEEVGLYYPNWYLSDVASDRVAFLLERMRGERSVQLGDRIVTVETLDELLEEIIDISVEINRYILLLVGDCDMR